MIKRCEICEGNGCSLCKGEGLYYDFDEDENEKYSQHDYENDEKWQAHMKKVVDATLKLAEQRSQSK